ncbi:hypothetical protein B7L88_gp058 [Rhizobium phage RHEph10]|uniref:hypothetical protein n=1 Tax=Rhizobium phage RHEph10 TaxID=1220717 RepID=UPI0002AB0DF4|nr:hypothetical protein B7L88_gp058 [Rhizobium phage RHEph10]AGC36102.1 hypothetical protein RHEph10_gp058 [Rhizobium phage RHEph10]
MFYRIISAGGALGVAIAIVNVAPVAWAANQWDTCVVILAANLTVLRWVLDAIEGEKSK